MKITASFVRWTTMAVTLSLLTITTLTFAQDGEKKEALERIKAKSFEQKMDAVESGFSTWDKLTPDQQAAAKAKAHGALEQAPEKARAAWSSMTPEEQKAAQEAAKANAKAGRENWQGLSEDEKASRKGEARSLIEERKARHNQ